MAVTGFQQTICRLLATNRLEQGEAYVAGGVALNLWDIWRGRLAEKTRASAL
jgi:hypothetical protein